MVSQNFFLFVQLLLESCKDLRVTGWTVSFGCLWGTLFEKHDYDSADEKDPGHKDKQAWTRFCERTDGSNNSVYRRLSV